MKRRRELFRTAMLRALMKNLAASSAASDSGA
jgi:hypothetical protein